MPFSIPAPETARELFTRTYSCRILYSQHIIASATLSRRPNTKEEITLNEPGKIVPWTTLAERPELVGGQLVINFTATANRGRIVKIDLAHGQVIFHLVELEARPLGSDASWRRFGQGGLPHCISEGAYVREFPDRIEVRHAGVRLVIQPASGEPPPAALG